MGTANLIPVDFNNCDEDGAVRLITRGTIAYKEKNDIEFDVGGKILMTDGELYAEGVLEYRDGMWVAKVSKKKTCRMD